MKVNEFAGTGGEEYALRHPWPAGCFVQGGHKGVVFGRTETYTTAYFEAFPDTFIRGEGETLEQAEDDAWERYLKRTSCPGHEWESRGYRNGGGFCKHCGTFESGAFTGEQLGQYCVDCQAPTTYTWVDDDFYCLLHAPVERDSDIDLRWRVDNDLELFGDPCNHEKKCCRYHGTHTMPHKGCILR